MSKADKVRNIIAYSGGNITGRTKMQKIACLLNLAGFDDDFSFDYRHYGPYSEELSSTIREAAILGFINEEERPTSWGGTYSIYTLKSDEPDLTSPNMQALIELANNAPSVVLELATTAAFLGEQGVDDPWKETINRKPEKAENGRIEKAKELYLNLQKINVPKELPSI